MCKCTMTDVQSHTNCFVLKNCTTNTTFKTMLFDLIPQSGQTDISGLDLHTEHNRSPSGHYNFIYFSFLKLIKGTVIVISSDSQVSFKS